MANTESHGLQLFHKWKIAITLKYWNFAKIFLLNFLENGRRFFHEVFRMCRGSRCEYDIFPN